MMETRRTRGKRIKFDVEYQTENGDASDSNDLESLDDIRKSRIRDSNKEYAKRMTILQTWCEHWSDYTTREGDAYPKKEAINILKKAKKILCPIESCRKAFTTFGGLRYHYARCNIERCFKCKVCAPPTEVKTKGDLLRHMIRSHHKELPALDGEQKEIANTYLSGTGRSEKSKKRFHPNDHETQMNFRHIVKAYYDMIERTFDPANHVRRPYKDWQTYSKDWELITYNIDRRRYYPPEQESPQIKTSTTSWCTLKVGESMIFNSGCDETASLHRTSDLMENVIFFTGGISTSAAWLPKPFIDQRAKSHCELLAISVKCCAMDKSFYYKDCKDFEGCVQFWTMQISESANLSGDTLTKTHAIAAKPELSFMIGHGWGNIFEMVWCPLGASWEPPDVRISEPKGEIQLSRIGLLAMACGDGQIRLISVPHKDNLLLNSTSLAQRTEDLIDSTPIFRVKPIACLAPPGAGQSTDYQTPACTALGWNLEDNQRLLVAGYSNGSVALFDLANFSPILYSNVEHYHIYRPYKTWFAHGLPVTGIAILSSQPERTFVATGGRDRQLKVWNPMDLNTCSVSDRAPITRLVWDHRLRGIVSSTEAAFTSFQNRVSYRYPVMDGTHSTITIATHRATVWGLTNSIITSSLATSDEAGEVLIAIYGRPVQKKDRNPSNTHCVFNILPRARHSPTLVANNNAASSSVPLYQSNTTMDNYAIQENKSQQQLANSDDLRVHHGDLITTNNGEVITTMQPAVVENETGDNLDIELDENNEEDVYGYAERQVANKPARFLLPIDHRAVETYEDFKHNFGLEYLDYDQIGSKCDQKMPESCLRASDLTKIYCDRVCDYPFSSVKHVSFSPNTNSFSYLLSVSHIGLCRLDKIKIIESIYMSHVESLSSSIAQKLHQDQMSAPLAICSASQTITSVEQTTNTR